MFGTEWGNIAQVFEIVGVNLQESLLLLVFAIGLVFVGGIALVDMFVQEIQMERPAVLEIDEWFISVPVKEVAFKPIHLTYARAGWAHVETTEFEDYESMSFVTIDREIDLAKPMAEAKKAVASLIAEWRAAAATEKKSLFRKPELLV